MVQSYLMNSTASETIAELHDLFRSRRLTLSVAESCTGGLVSHYLTLLPGASDFFVAGIVAYSESAKKDILGVSQRIIDSCGMISEETAREMVHRMRLLAGSDYSLATTGNLGPNALEGKERGLVYVAASTEDKTSVRRLLLTQDRNENKRDAANAALQLLIDFAKSNEEDIP
jgi:PncC family amidohydrolase